MANKRTLKKHISYVCSDIASECIVASQLFNGADVNAFNNLIGKVAMLQADTIAKVNVVFDKAPGEFETKAAYNKARHQYFAKAYSSLLHHFYDSVQAIVDEMNKAMPHHKEA